MEPAEAPEVTQEVSNIPDNVQQIRTWRDELPDGIKGDPSLQDIPDVGTLVKRYIDTKAMVGSSVRIPTDDAGQEAIEAFVGKLIDNPQLGLMRRPDPENPETMAQVHQALGVPEDASGYERPEAVDAEAFGAMAETAKNLGLTKQQYSALAEAYANYGDNQVKQIVQQREENVKQLRGEWGHSFDERVTRAQETVKALGGHPMLEKALADGAADAATLRFLDTIATQMGKEGTQLAQQLSRVEHSTRSELEQRRDELIQRQLTENLTGRQREDLQARVVKISEELAGLAS